MLQKYSSIQIFTITMHFNSHMGLDLCFKLMVHCSVDYNGRQSTISRTKTLNDRSVLFCTDVVTDQIL